MTSHVSFWIHKKAEYPELAKIALNDLVPVPLTYLDETGCSTMNIVKTKYRKSMNVRSPLRVALSSFVPRLSKIAKKYSRLIIF